MAILFSACGVLGCKKEQQPAKHELSEVTAVSISCGHMDRSFGYSFWAHKEENGWLLDAECFTQSFNIETSFENRELDSEDGEELLEILKNGDSIAYAMNYKKPKKSVFKVADEETYGFCLTFSDGSQYVTYDRQKGLEEFFYRLAEKHDETISK